jgi:two-component system, NarL family, nitrate/nitrite response regulator NarL
VPHTPPTLRVLVVDDQALFRKALAGLVNAQLDMTVVGEADNGLEALAGVRTLAPDVVVMDVNMPVAGGVEGVRAIRGAGYSTKIVMLTVSEEVLFDDIRGVIRGEAPIAPAIAHKLLEALRDGPPRPHGSITGEGTTELTRRETEILQLVAGGASNKEIANQLTITEGTVKNHVHNTLEKLHLTNRTQAAAYSVAQGMPVTRTSGPDRP